MPRQIRDEFIDLPLVRSGEVSEYIGPMLTAQVARYRSELAKLQSEIAIMRSSGIYSSKGVLEASHQRAIDLVMSEAEYDLKGPLSKMAVDEKRASSQVVAKLHPTSTLATESAKVQQLLASQEVRRDFAGYAVELDEQTHIRLSITHQDRLDSITPGEALLLEAAEREDVAVVLAAMEAPSMWLKRYGIRKQAVDLAVSLLAAAQHPEEHGRLKVIREARRIYQDNTAVLERAAAKLTGVDRLTLPGRDEIQIAG